MPRPCGLPSKGLALAGLLLLSTALFFAPLNCSSSYEYAAVLANHVEPTLPLATVDVLTARQASHRVGGSASPDRARTRWTALLRIL